MTAVTPVAPGTAENLARVRHFRDLLTRADGTDAPDAWQLDVVAHFLIGRVGDGCEAPAALWDTLADDCRRLWHLISDDWDNRDLDDLDELADDDFTPYASHDREVDARYEATRNRLGHDIEHAVFLARYAYVENKRAAERRAHRADVEARIHPVDAAMRRHPAGSKMPAHLTGSSRRGGGDPIGDYRYLKGEL